MAKSRRHSATSDMTANKPTGNDAGIRLPATQEQRFHYVEIAAYYIAQRRGFDGGSPEEDWAAAELEIDRLLGEGQFNH